MMGSNEFLKTPDQPAEKTPGQPAEKVINFAAVAEEIQS